MTRIWLCADDYGISPSVNAAIRDLLVRGRINATSVMVVAPSLHHAEALALQTLNTTGRRVAIGLHVTLSAPFRPLSDGFRPLRNGAFPALPALLMRACLRSLEPDALIAEIARQLRVFVEHFGRTPDFIDGHQHVQALPIVRDAVLAFARRRDVPIRTVELPVAIDRSALPAQFKAMLLSEMGRRLSTAADGFALNHGFLGVRSFHEKEPYRTLFRRWLSLASPDSLIMCHPGIPDETLAMRDSVTTARAEEFQYLSGPGYLADRAERLAKHKI